MRPQLTLPALPSTTQPSRANASSKGCARAPASPRILAATAPSCAIYCHDKQRSGFVRAQMYGQPDTWPFVVVLTLSHPALNALLR